MNCEKVEGEKVYIVLEEDFLELPYIQEGNWFIKRFCGGFCYRHTGAIYIRESRKNDKLLLCHERGHLRGLGHTWKLGYLMNPCGLFRGWKE